MNNSRARNAFSRAMKTRHCVDWADFDSGFRLLWCRFRNFLLCTSTSSCCVQVRVRLVWIVPFVAPRHLGWTRSIQSHTTYSSVGAFVGIHAIRSASRIKAFLCQLPWTARRSSGKRASFDLCVQQTVVSSSISKAATTHIQVSCWTPRQVGRSYRPTEQGTQLLLCESSRHGKNDDERRPRR